MTEKKTHILSVDVEDWPQSTWDYSKQITERVKNNTYKMLELFSKYNVRTTCFVLGLVAEKYPELVKDIVKEKHELASHGYGHIPVFTLTPEQFKEDVEKSKKLLEDISGKEVIGYRAPDFSVTGKSLWALDILAAAGYRYDSSIYPIEHPRYGIPGENRFAHVKKLQGGKELIEFPLTTWPLGKRLLPTAGGGYLRIFPLAYSKMAIKHYEKLGKKALIYLHPYEVDPGELSLYKKEVPFKLRLTQFTGRSSVESKLERLFKKYNFISLQEHLEEEKEKLYNK